MASLGRSPGAAPLTSADIPDDSITGAKIVDDAIDSEHYAAGSIDAAHVAADVATQAELDAIASVPSNLVAYRASGESTPSGWSEYTSVRGRMIVGLPSGGADAGTVGTAYTTAQDKSISIAHTHDGPVHTHSIGYIDYWSVGQIRVADHPYGNDGIYSNDHYISMTGNNNAGTELIQKTHTQSSRATTEQTTGETEVVTSDILAYIQLMVIKKD